MAENFGRILAAILAGTLAGSLATRLAVPNILLAVPNSPLPGVNPRISAARVSVPIEFFFAIFLRVSYTVFFARRHTSARNPRTYASQLRIMID